MALPLFAQRLVAGLGAGMSSRRERIVAVAD